MVTVEGKRIFLDTFDAKFDIGFPIQSILDSMKDFRVWALEGVVYVYGDDKLYVWRWLSDLGGPKMNWWQEAKPFS